MSDKAERLHQLVGKIREVAQTTLQPGTNNSLLKAPLWQAFNPISEQLGYSDYGELLDAFLALCQSVRNDVAVIPMRKESVRASWLSCIKELSMVFDAKNFGQTTKDAFNSHFSVRNLEVLDSISERFQAADFKESSYEELEDALNAVRETVAAFTASGKLDERIAAILKHYLQQMETVFSHVRDFGDDMFWKLYKETFATFMQVHPVIADLENKEEIIDKLKTVRDKLTAKSIVGLSLAANVATIGTALYPLLP